VAYQQPTIFEGERYYIGIEAWLRDPANRVKKRIQALQAEHPNNNITFIDQALGAPGESNRQERRDTGTKEVFDGPYDPTTILPDGVADQIVLGNMVGDRHIAHSTRRAGLLLGEVSRLIAEDGVMVIRETESPRRAHRHLKRRSLRRVGLQTIGTRITPGDKEMWERLEARYRASKRFDKGLSYYQFLAKTVAR
jgi:hypothetical protein